MTVDADTQSESDDSATNGADASEKKRLIEARDKAKKKAREIEAENEALKAKLEESEAAKEAAEGDVLKQLERAEKKIEKLTGKIGEYQQAEETRTKEGRLASFVEAVAKKAGGANPTLVEGMLRSLQAKKGLDIHPEEVTDDLASETFDILKSELPDTFAPKSGGPAPAPGLSRKLPPQELSGDALDAHVLSLAKGIRGGKRPAQ